MRGECGRWLFKMQADNGHPGIGLVAVLDVLHVGLQKDARGDLHDVGRFQQPLVIAAVIEMQCGRAQREVIVRSMRERCLPIEARAKVSVRSVGLCIHTRGEAGAHKAADMPVLP